MTKSNNTLSIKEFLKKQPVLVPVPPVAVNFMDRYEHLPDDIKQLVRIHTFKRPHNSKTVDLFVEQFLIEPFANAAVHLETLYSKTGEPLAVVITTDITSRTLFSAHVDTVHSTSGRQCVEYDHEMGLMLKTQDAGKKDNECLGADDGAGVWVLLQMIKANVPGTYAFHYGEERGGVGSSAIAIEHRPWLARFDRAIAVDRKGTDNIITHQGWGRCCSDDFAKALAAQFNMAGQNHSFKPDSGGVFTDTANYTDDIPECTNLSCGYEAQHTHNESLDVEFLIRLKDAMLVVDWESLPTVRKAGEVDSLYDNYDLNALGGYGKEVITPQKADKTDILRRLSYMTTGNIKNWVRKASVDEIAAVIAEAADKIYELEDEITNLQEDVAYYTALEESAEEADDRVTKGMDEW
jgi:hypothetical protein